MCDGSAMCINVPVCDGSATCINLPVCDVSIINIAAY